MRVPHQQGTKIGTSHSGKCNAPTFDFQTFDLFSEEHIDDT